MFVFIYRKSFGDRLRPNSGGGGGGNDDSSGSGRPGSSGSDGSVPNRFGGTSPSSGSGGSSYPNRNTLTQLKRLYPHLFPTGPDAGLGGSGGGGGGGSDPSFSGPSGSPRYPSILPGGGAYVPSGGSGGGVNGRPTSIARPKPATPASFYNGTQYPSSLYPSRYPGNLLSSLTANPQIRNSTYPGIPGYIRYDYPGYTSIPFTGFRCDLQPYKYGYYADTRAGCQVFHICQKDGRMDSFLCPNGTLFSQKVMTCEWWYHVNCPSSPGYYYLNGRLGVLPFLPATLNRFD